LIVVDTSAIMAILLDEAEADACVAELETHDELAISAATVAETLIVADRRGVGEEARMLLDGLGIDVVPVTAASPSRIASIYRRWGKGNHPAGLNFGDCFAYDLASERGCPLLFVGNDFTQTDIAGVLQAGP
jgi:ribonuclease VapC